MPVRWYVTDIIGDGRSVETRYRPRLPANASLSWSAVVPVRPNGTLRSPWCLVVVDATTAQHAQMSAESRNVSLPDAVLDAPIPAAGRAGLRTALVAKGVPGAVIDSATSMRDLVGGLGRALDPAYDERNHRVEA